MWSQGLNLIIPVGPFQQGIFCDSMTVWFCSLLHSPGGGTSLALHPCLTHGSAEGSKDTAAPQEHRVPQAPEEMEVL